MKEIVTVDLDSTLCDTGHRQKTIVRDGTMDWDAYSKACVKDVPVQATVELVRIMWLAGMEIHYVSGRTVAAEQQTREWLKTYSPTPYAGLWMDDTEDGDHFAAYGGHSQYKLHRIRQVEEETGGVVVLHIDDWISVKVTLEEAGIPCLCVRTPQEVEATMMQEIEENPA